MAFVTLDEARGEELKHVARQQPSQPGRQAGSLKTAKHFGHAAKERVDLSSFRA